MDLTPIITQLGTDYRGSTSLDSIKKYISRHDLLALDDSTTLKLDSLAKQVQELCIKNRLPHLLVDWNTLPNLGAQCQPHFLLVLTNEYRDAKPNIQLSFRPELDFNAADLSPNIRQTTPGQWTWFFPFAVSQGGEDCRAGDYVLSVDINFDRTVHEMPRNLHCDIRLTIPQKHQNNRTLEIDANGKSLINLQGLDLNQFGHIKLSGSDLAALNSVDYQSHSDDSSHKDNVSDSVVHEYRLEYDLYSFAETSKLITRETKLTRATNASLKLGEKNLIIETQNEITFGRSRNANIVLRAMPRSATNDQASRRMSRIHATINLSDSGITISRNSNKSLRVNNKPIEHHSSFQILADDPQSGQNIDIQFGNGHILDVVATPHFFSSSYSSFRRQVIESQGKSLRSELTPKPNGGDNLGFVHIRRKHNIINEEYFLIYESIPIGSDCEQCGIVLSDIPAVAAELFEIQGIFHLCLINADVQIEVSGIDLEYSQIIPLVHGDVIRIGQHQMLFNRFQQLFME